MISLVVHGQNYALDVTVCGLIIVFSVLILLVIIISVFGKIMDKVNGKTSKKKSETIKPFVAVPEVKAENDEEEIVAAISAAVATMYEGSDKTPVIKTIRPIAKRSEWKHSGVVENMRSFF